MSQEKKNKKIKIAILVLWILLAAGIVAGIGLGISKNKGKDTSNVKKDDGIYTVNILKTAHGSVTANKIEAQEGEEIVLTVTPDENYELKSLVANKKKTETTFKMPAEDVDVFARFALKEGIFVGGKFFGKSGEFFSSDAIDFSTDNGEKPYLVMDATKATPLYAYINELNATQFFFETEVQVTGINDGEKYPKFGIMTSDETEMVKYYLDMSSEKKVSAVGTVHQATGKSDDWKNQDVFPLDKEMKISKKTVKLGFLRNGKTYYFYVNDKLVSTGTDIQNKAGAAGVFTFGTSLKLTDYRLVESGSTYNKLLSQAKADAKKFNGFRLTTNHFKETKDGVYTLKTNSADEGKVDDVKYGGKVLKAAYYSIKGKITLKNSKDWSQARILVSADAKNEYVFALEQTAKNKYQIFTMSKNNEKVWNNWTSIVDAAVNGNRNSLDFEVIADGRNIYFLIDDMVVYTTKQVSMKESTVKFAGYKNCTTVVEKLDGQVFESSAAVQKYLATKDTESFWAYGLTTNFFEETKDGVYTLRTTKKDESKVDDVIYGGNIFKETYYSVKGKISLSNADDWSQARILISADAKNEHVIALEKTAANKYQIFAMSKENEEIWEHWTSIVDDYMNGDRNTIDFEVVVDKNVVYFLIDDVICYKNDNVSMKESVVKFSNYGKSTTTVENIKGNVFANSKDVKKYLETKKEKATVGENFGLTVGDGVTYATSSGVNLEQDKGTNPFIELYKDAPRYAYLNNTFTNKACFEAKFSVSEVLNGDAYPKFGMIFQGKTESLKFFVDMNSEMKASAVGVVHQAAGGDDDWANVNIANVDGMKFTGEDTVKLSVVRDVKAYYFYVNDKLVLVEEYGFTEEKTAVGVFSFNNILTVSDYKVCVDDAAGQYIAQAKADAIYTVSTYHFKETSNGVYTLNTSSSDEGKVDNVERVGKTVKEAYYSIKGNISLTDANDWGQARILISADPQNEYVIALEKTNANKYQIFTMSKAGENGWNDWRLISHADVNANRNSLDFEVIVIEKQMYFLIDDEIYYASDRVNMTESTVKFAGYNKATTTVKNLDGQIFETKEDAKAYLETKTEKTYESAFQAQIDARYKEYFEDRDCRGKGGTVILGHSHMDPAFWTDWENQTGLNKYVTGYNVGIGGTTTLDWLYAYDKLVKPFNADKFVISVGENDVRGWGRDGAEVVESLAQLFEKIHADHPNAEIYYIYSLPAEVKYANGKWLDAEYEALVNGEKALCDSLSYVTGVDTFSVLVNSITQNVKTELFGANQDIHLNQNGYKVWSDYLYTKIFKGANFGVTVGDGVTYKTTNGIDLLTDKGANATINIFEGAPRYAYLNDSFTNKFYFEAEVNVSQVLNNDAWPKFGLMFNGKTEMVKYFVDMSPQMEASNVGVVHQKTGQGDDWGNSISKAVSGMKFKGNDKVKLAVVRDGRDYYFYVNGALVLSKKNALYNEDGAVGIFSFNSVMTVSNYKFYKGTDADSYIAAAKAEVGANFFGAASTFTTTSDVDLSKDIGALTGTTTVNTGGSKFLYARDFYQQNYYFETKVHVNQVYNDDAWPKFGILVQEGTIQELFFVDMRPDKTANKVGVVRDYNWGGSVSKNVDGMKFSGDGEYVTLGLLKQAGKFTFYVNGNQVLTYNSSFTGKTTVGVFGFNTGMILKDYYVEKR